MAEICVIEDKSYYWQISEFNSETEDFSSLFQRIDSTLKEKMQDVVLSLSQVRVLYSSHLAVFVRINQMLRKNNQNFILADISPEIRNLLQITQLDSIFPIYDTLDDFKKNSKNPKKASVAEENFEWQIVKNSEDSASVICKGDMVSGESLGELQKSIINFYSLSFDFSNLESMDQASVDFLSNIIDKHSVQVVGANEELLELFRQKQIYGKMKLL